ncbi:MAG: DUF5686 and carboxypeptidase regulatory-like domain-containing protein [Bacteroidales bacterium]|jgi:hypothetical protein|nr:DUF5686 and carboxypeptidase regulatory-like domain-containing protein [Bacteroidales bacterium]
MDLYSILGRKIIFFLVLCFGVHAHAQTVKGIVVDIQGKPVEYATIYVVETKMGCSTSESGEFVLSLKAGSYTCVIQHLSYKTITQTIHVPQESYLEIKLEPKTILLQEVKIRAKEEDKAYSIIRRTVAKSPYYQNQLLKYTATFYAKGSLKIKNVPKLITKILEEEIFREGDVYTAESVSEVRVTPEKTEQRVISQRNSLPRTVSIDALNFGYYNIYQNAGGSFVSPVTKDGLSLYHYRWEYSYRDNERLIHHIKVIPRNKSPFTFSGYIDIIDGSWHVYNFDFRASVDVGIVKADIRVKEIFIPIEENVWMPGSMHIASDAKSMGFNGTLSTVYSIQYKDYEANPVLYASNPAVEVLPTASTPQKKAVVSKKSERLTQEITEITQKENLTTRDAIKLVEKIDAKAKEDRKNNPQHDSINPLEVQKRFFMTIDSNANNYDSVLWANYRTVPLSDEELKSFDKKIITDSILSVREKEREERLSQKRLSRKKNFNLFKNKMFSMGIGWQNSTLAFNTVEGFKGGINLYANQRFKDSVRSLRNEINFGYAFGSKHCFLYGTSKWEYNPKRFAFVELSAGKQTCDFNAEQQQGKYAINTVSSLFFRENIIQYYDRIFVDIKHSTEVFNGFQVAVGLLYEQQNPLENRSDYSFFFRKKEYKSNVPNNRYLADNAHYTVSHTTFVLDVSIRYTPKMHYRYSGNGKIKQYAGSKYPSFTLTWKKGINKVLGSDSRFDFLALNIAQKINAGVLKTFGYSISAGGFPYAKSIHFSQFQHFSTNNFWVAFNSFTETFNTMPNYKYSTCQGFVSAHVKYEMPYLVLKYIPGLNKTLITENLHLSFVSNPLTRGYVEVGYSLAKIYFLGYIGVFVGADEFKDVHWSIRAGFSLFE